MSDTVLATLWICAGTSCVITTPYLSIDWICARNSCANCESFKCSVLHLIIFSEYKYNSMIVIYETNWHFYSWLNLFDLTRDFAHRKTTEMKAPRRLYSLACIVHIEDIIVWEHIQLSLLRNTPDYLNSLLSFFLIAPWAIFWSWLTVIPIPLLFITATLLEGVS